MESKSLHEVLKTHFEKLLDRKLNSSVWPPTKEDYRNAHLEQRSEKLMSNLLFLSANKSRLINFIANGVDIRPKAIIPEIKLVQPNTLEADLFRFLSLNWSIPVSEGYGRRMRFLVWDRSNEKVLGIFALGDAVFNLKVRDDYIGWNAETRKNKLVNIMDAYILGAAPGYNLLLGGKLIASLVKTQEIVSLFREKYKNSVGLISGNSKNPYLSYVTLTSALGRSSVYNRLKLNDDQIFKKIGQTSGWGHFHVSKETFSLLVEYLESINDPYFKSYDFGKGPNWRIRVIKRGLSLLGIDSTLMQHGYQREVYLCELANNSLDFINGNSPIPDYSSLKTVKELSKLALDRWVIPRSERNAEYLSFKKESFIDGFSH